MSVNAFLIGSPTVGGEALLRGCLAVRSPRGRPVRCGALDRIPYASMTWIRFEGIVRLLPHHLSPFGHPQRAGSSLEL